jgi:hypothetical protein
MRYLRRLSGVQVALILVVWSCLVAGLPSITAMVVRARGVRSHAVDAGGGVVMIGFGYSPWAMMLLVGVGVAFIAAWRYSRR